LNVKGVRLERKERLDLTLKFILLAAFIELLVISFFRCHNYIVLTFAAGFFKE